MIGTTEIRVRYAETDQMGRAHHSHYLVWCELARTDFMRDHGISYAELEATGILLPVSRVEIEYRAPLTYDERVLIRTRVDRVRSREVVFGYDIVAGGGGGVAAKARITLVSVDRSGRPVRLPVDARQTLERLAPGSRGGDA